MTINVSIGATLLPLEEIAGWQVSSPPAKNGQLIAALPALQRGAVWNVQQIEELWDSIIRRFPIGAFVIAPPNEKLKTKSFKLQSYQKGRDDPLEVEKDKIVQTWREPTHLLLDGQQRATGIALGFLDIWTNNLEDAKSAIWVDLAPPPQTRDVAIIFRVVTRSHPWGYKRSEPSSPLSSSQIRPALQAFRESNDMPDARPNAFKLQQTWPWDADAPVPLALLISAVSQTKSLSEARQHAWNSIQNLPLLKEQSSSHKTSRTKKDLRTHRDTLERQRMAIRSAFNDEPSPTREFVDELLERLRKLMCEKSAYLVPVLPLDFQDAHASIFALNDRDLATSHEDAAKKDNIELLFIRVNNAGTPLQGEELTYSMLKAAWPDAARFIENLKNKPAQASRIATLCTRLTLARAQQGGSDDKKLTLPPVPRVSEFRRLVRNQSDLHPNFYEELTEFIENDANELFITAWLFLTSKPFGLLPALAVDLAQKSQNTYFLLLRWLDRLQQAQINPMNLSDADHRRTLGFLTAIAWFAKDETKACASIWPALQNAPSKKLSCFFNREQFSKTCGVDSRFNLKMTPLPTVEELKLACQRGVTGYRGCKNTISNSDSSIWSDWVWHESFSDQFTKVLDLEKKWVDLLKPESGSREDRKELVLQSAIHFTDALWKSRQILLYSQREWLRHWYPDFDPSLPENMEDKNRPWDFDHIFPQNLMRTDRGGTRHNIPDVIWDWFGSIGNLRAWPLEANRSDGALSPRLKFREINDEEKLYGITNFRTKMKASLIDEDDEWPLWESCVPVNDDGTVVQANYLAKKDYHECRQALVKAIVFRFIRLYTVWYRELNIEELQPNVGKLCP